MKRYLKNERDYIKWCCNHKWKYFIYDTYTTSKGKIYLEYYPIEYNIKVIQYDLNSQIVMKWDNLIEPCKAYDLDIEELFNHCKIPFGRYCGYIWEVV